MHSMQFNGIVVDSEDVVYDNDDDDLRPGILGKWPRCFCPGTPLRRKPLRAWQVTVTNHILLQV